MLSVQSLYENWNKVSRNLYVHKLVKSNKVVDTDLRLLKEKHIITDLNDVYIYSFIHPDNNQVISFTGSNILKPGITTELFLSFVSPSRTMLSKGMNMPNDFNSKTIVKDKFITSSYLFNGENVEFKKVSTIPMDIVNTSGVLPIVLAFTTYEKYNIDCLDNKFNIYNINIKRFKAWSLPQIPTKSNYLYTYKCKVK